MILGTKIFFFYDLGSHNLLMLKKSKYFLFSGQKGIFCSDILIDKHLTKIMISHS